MDRLDESRAVIQSVPASTEDVDPPPYAAAAAAAVKEEVEVSDVESEGVPGCGEPFPAVAVTLVPAAKRQRTARGEQRTAFQKLH